MAKSKANISKVRESTRVVIGWVAACIAFVVGIGLCVAGFIVPPTGEISPSVLTALGELLTFFGGIFGIGSYTKLKMHQIDRMKID